MALREGVMASGWGVTASGGVLTAWGWGQRRALGDFLTYLKWKVASCHEKQMFPEQDGQPGDRVEPSVSFHSLIFLHSA